MKTAFNRFVVLRLLKFVYQHIKALGIDYDDKQVRELGRLIMRLDNEMKRR